MNKKETKLLPCPFCGSKSSIFEHLDDNYTIRCNNSIKCGCMFYRKFPNKEEAIKFWNKRAKI